ncbi:type VII secretion-associated serine protease mycosin [Micromonospora sp. CP22]|uniref:type VII secretion-associated serine protease mycosin n=1 Tax=Micromonospora sp. CP22 TaxID=2580517 RepID=UPI0012BCA29C|nr:type VII secretion-associated serine protease mycosin [Micromonospora sp. CP22]MTK01367.1 type VII secretion-associated serine protease mycosin [Micromonospora sp. CP22]
MDYTNYLAAALLATTLTLSPPLHSSATTTRQPASISAGQQWHLQYLSVGKVHDISQGDGVVVAIIDTGVHPHADLQDNLHSGTDLIRNGGNGQQDNDGHGTAMAGLIAAHGKGPEGAVGVAPQASILPIKFKDRSSGGTTENLAQAIMYAINNGADIISISSGGEQSLTEQKAIQAAIDADIVVIAAAGNLPTDKRVQYPAAYPGVVAVGGVDRTGHRASVSVTGDEIDIVAPAVELVSTSFDGGYRVGTGTSGAAAIVAGAAALVRAKYPYLPADEVVHRLTATAIDKGPPGRDDQYGYGVIDLVAALTADVPPRGFESVPTVGPDGAGPTTAAADRPRADGQRVATIRGLVTLGVLVAAGAGWALVVRRRRRSDDPPPPISR